MLKSGSKSSEVQTGVGTIAAAIAAIAVVIFPDQASDLTANDITSTATTVKELASSLQLQFAQYVSGLVAKYGFAGGALVFVYKVWSRMSADRTHLKIAELEKLVELKREARDE